jgi:predicted transport protein
MSDIKLFKINGQSVKSIEVKSVEVEKSLQTLMETHLEIFLGIRFLDTEYSTGKTHGGRIDTLGVDENDCPVIIEYKRSLNENVINQGLYYLDWLLDHKAEFTLLMQKKFGNKSTENIDWSGARLLCIAGEFTKYDGYAVKQINRNIELLRYRKYEDDLLLLELVNASTGDAESELNSESTSKNRYSGSTVSEKLEKSSTDLKDRFENLKAFLMALGDDVQVKTLKFYFAFARIKNFASVEVHPQTNKIVVFVKNDFSSVQLEEGFTRDVRNIGHYGTGDLEITISSDADLERAKSLMLQSYEVN